MAKEETKDFIDQTPSKAVGVFEDHGVQIFIYKKKDETADEAIARVAKNHGVQANAVRKLKS